MAFSHPPAEHEHGEKIRADATYGILFREPEVSPGAEVLPELVEYDAVEAPPSPRRRHTGTVRPGRRTAS